MDMRLKTTLRTYPKVSESILNDVLVDYVTKDELEAKDYVTHSELSNILKDFVREVENPDAAIIYGRKMVNGVMTWVSIDELPEVINDIVCFGVVDSSEIKGENILALNRMGLDPTIFEYNIQYNPVASGYMWFCSTTPIADIRADNGLDYSVKLVEQEDKITVMINEHKMRFTCYRTADKIVALPGVTYKFKIKI